MIKAKESYNSLAMVVILILLFLALIVIVNYTSPGKTGYATLGIETNYVPNESLKGNILLSLNPGELIPSNSIVSIKMKNTAYNYTLSQLINEEALNGNFYIEGASLTGEGSGYGKAGEKRSYPEVSFTMKISTYTVQETPSDDLNETPSEPIAETPSDDLNETLSEPIAETPSEPIAETPSEPIAETPSEPAVITGSMISELSFEVQGVVSKESPYTYTLEEGQAAEISSSSQTVNLKTEGNIVTITTDYYELEEGFGADYSTASDSKYIINIDLNQLNIMPEEGDLTTSIDYQDINLATVTTNLNTNEQNKSVLPEELNNITSNQSQIENLDYYELTNEEKFMIQGLGDNTIKVTKAQESNGRLIIRFTLGSYWLESSYDYPNTNLEDQIELDKARWIKSIAREITKPVSNPKEVSEFIGNYSI
jgi:hypothetical protein